MNSSGKLPFSREQRRCLTLCFLSYAAAYTGRLNLSAALVGLKNSLALTDARAGLFQTVFALAYAAGQVFNGSRVDRVSARRSIAVGLFASAVCNLIFGLTENAAVLTAVWALNGAAQSMLWTPIVKLTATWFSGAERERASVILSVTIICGHLAAWGLSGTMASMFHWRFSFLLPAAILAAAGIAAAALLRDRPDAEAADPSTVKAAPAVGRMALRPLIRSTGLAALLACCICNGFVRDSIVTWGPTILAESGGLSLNATLVSLVIPILNLCGVMVVRRCYRLLGGSARGAVGILLAGSAVVSLLMLPSGLGVIWSALMLGLCCAANSGINPMINTLIPMEYDGTGRVGLVAGLVDCFIYLGSALSGVVTGALSDAIGWHWVYAVWAFVSFAGALLAFCSAKRGKALTPTR